MTNTETTPDGYVKVEITTGISEVPRGSYLRPMTHDEFMEYAGKLKNKIRTLAAENSRLSSQLFEANSLLTSFESKSRIYIDKYCPGLREGRGVVCNVEMFGRSLLV